jgi:hypothetical protein
MELEAELRDRLLDPTRSSVADAVQFRAQVDWVVWSRMADEVDAALAEIDASDAPPLVKQAERSAVPGEVGRRIFWSDAQVSNLAVRARRLRDRAPQVWEAFREGRIDEARAREVSSAVDKLQRTESIERLDRRVVAYAESHTVAEVRRWLKVFVARVEADLFAERAGQALADRGVDLAHGDDGVSWLMISHGSHVIAAIDKRLTKEANAIGADDPRTLQQRRADLFAAWMTTNECGEAALNADIAVTMPGSAVAGANNAPAVAADASWVVPAEWIIELTRYDGNNVFWHRMLLDPFTDDVLAHEYKGRFVPSVLAKAIEFRDGVCQAPGCCRPASQCDIDHRIPHEQGGPTSGWNLGPYCRRHHIQKGFGLIDTGPTATSPPGRSRNAPLHSLGAPEMTPRPEPTGLIIEFAWPEAA